MKRIVLYLFIVFSTLNILAQQPEKIELNGNWKFKKGDNPEWASQHFDRKDWDYSYIPTWDWQTEYYGYGWYAKEISLSKKETYFFNLGQVDDDCEVYFNGHLLSLYQASSEKSELYASIHDQWKRYRSYYIPKEFVNENKNNTIAIRVWNTLGGQGGIRYGNVFISNTVFHNQLPIELGGNWLRKGQADNEWLIGFYNNSAIYKNKVWAYKNIKKENGNI